LLGAGQRSGYGRLVSSETGRPVGPPLLHQLYRGLIAFTPDERAVATTRYNFWVGGSQEVHLYDTATARPLAPPVPLPTYAHGIAASPDGKTVAVARLVSTTLIDVDTGRIVRELPEKTCVAAVAFHPDGTRLAAAGRHGWHGLGAGFRLWDPAAGRPLGDFHGLADVPTTPSVHFLDGGRTVLAYGADTRSTALLDVASGVVRPGPRLPGRVAALAVRGDGPVVAVGSADGGVGQVNLTDGAAVGPPMPQPYPVTGLEYSPDGGLLAVACADRTVRLWDTATGLPVGPPLFHAGEVLAVRFASAGREVVSATAAGEVRRWPLPDPAPDDPDALGLWVEVAAGRGGDGRLLDPVAWEGRRADLGRRWPDGAAALDRVRTGPAADADWHDARAREAEATGNTFAAVWHLDRLARARPADWHAHARRADALLRAGDAAGAAAADAEAGRLAGPAVWADWLAHRADGGAAGGR
ncbi:MAG TPA: hypothetical protein VH092_02205, partial [Urbifossiella sp.]|nr:hypothetical protein [Urbifossiella sp.]